MDGFNASFPLWLLGAPLLCAIVNWMRTPKAHGSTQNMGPQRATAAA